MPTSDGSPHLDLGAAYTLCSLPESLRTFLNCTLCYRTITPQSNLNQTKNTFTWSGERVHAFLIFKVLLSQKTAYDWQCLPKSRGA